jgi:hypothetical protein
MFCAPGLIFGGAEGVGSHFHVMCARIHFRRYRGRWDPFSSSALAYSFSAVPSASRPVFIFCGSGLVFGGSLGVGSRFHVLGSRTRFRRYRRRQVLFSCFTRPESFSAILRTSRPVFMFLRARTRVPFKYFARPKSFRRYRGPHVPFSYFTRSDSFSAVPRASGPVFMLCSFRLIFGGTGGVGSSFHVLRPRTHFRRYRETRLPFSCFTRPDSFSAVPGAWGPVFMFCALDSFSAVERASGPIFLFCAPGLVFGVSDCVMSRFHILRSQTRFLR